MTKPGNLIQTPDELLESLRPLKRQLFRRELETQIGKLSEAERVEFVNRRLELSNLIGRLETQQLGDIRQQLEAQSEDLNAGISSLTQSLEEIEKAAQVAQGLGKLLGAVSKIVPVVG